MSPVPPHAPTGVRGFWKHGRFYGGYRIDKYQFPIDTEDLNRIDMFHNYFLLARGGAAYSYPVRPDARILDLGTGSGIWAIHVAEEYLPAAQVMAVDLNLTQPRLIPPNFEAKQLDLEEDDWSKLLDSCDIVHMRMLLGSISNLLWPMVYERAFERTAPGHGYIEQVEIDWIPQWEGSEVPEHSALLEWAQLFLQGMDGFGRSARVNTGNVKQMMEAAGFVDFQEQVIRCYVNPWSEDPDEQLAAQWFNLCLTDSVEPLSLAPLIENLGMSYEQISQLRQRVKTECCTLRYHAYCVMHIWTARRPDQ